MKFEELKNKLWFNVFIRIAAIFLVFVLILSLSNVTLLVSFFSFKERNALKEQTLAVSRLDISDANSCINAITQINEKYNFDVEIYDKSGKILYTTHGGQMMDFFHQNNDRFMMNHEELEVIKTELLSDGVIFETAIRRFDKNRFLLCRKDLDNGYTVEVRIQQQLITNSAAIANEFIIIVSLFCLVLSIVWVFVFARKFSKPIMEMNDITRNMAELNFDKKIAVTSNDEIGQLAESVNELSDSLSAALKNLENTNAKLRDDIELERQLDVMRRGFVANVSHELKTPISIISGYAEGLKLNVNESAKESYCNTIIEESERMNRLVLSILELSRYESGQIPINKQNFDISVLTEGMLTRIFKGKNITVRNKIPVNTVCYADAFQIEQVLKSLLENALSHTPEGGNVTTDVTETDKNFRISVFNSGSHIDDELMPQIWQSFFRGDKSHKRQSSRFGLGLSIVTAIMKLHGTSCGVQNTSDGVVFWFETEKGNNLS